jgi:hypothetical protein
MGLKGRKRLRGSFVAVPVVVVKCDVKNAFDITKFYVLGLGASRIHPWHLGPPGGKFRYVEGRRSVRYANQRRKFRLNTVGTLEQSGIRSDQSSISETRGINRELFSLCMPSDRSVVPQLVWRYSTWLLVARFAEALAAES